MNYELIWLMAKRQGSRGKGGSLFASNLQPLSPVFAIRCPKWDVLIFTGGLLYLKALSSIKSGCFVIHVTRDYL